MAGSSFKLNPSFWICAGAAALAGLAALSACATNQAPRSRPSSQPDNTGVTMTVVYDNNPGSENLTAAWGFACVIQGLERTILFDTGGDGRILLENMRRLGINPVDIDAVVLSHIHGDHTGGLWSFLEVRTGIPVYMPAGFPTAFKERVRDRGAVPREADHSESICPGACTTGTLGRGAIEEHGLCVKTGAGWVLITGCAHPGVDNLAAQTREVTGGPIGLVLGGFHMGGESTAQIDKLITRFEEMGVQRVAPCHCSGEQARQHFQQRFGQRCELAGVGSVFRLPPAR